MLNCAVCTVHVYMMYSMVTCKAFVAVMVTAVDEFLSRVMLGILEASLKSDYLYIFVLTYLKIELQSTPRNFSHRSICLN